LNKLFGVEVGVVVVLDDVLPPADPHFQAWHGELGHILVVNVEEQIRTSSGGRYGTEALIQIRVGEDDGLELDAHPHLLLEEVGEVIDLIGLQESAWPHAKLIEIFHWDIVIGYDANIGSIPAGKKSNLGGKSQRFVDGPVDGRTRLVEVELRFPQVHCAADTELAVGEVDEFALWLWLAERLEES